MRRLLNQTLVGLGHLPQVLAESMNPLRAPVDIVNNGLLRHGYKVYSQCDEDGILDEIFARIGSANQRFVEVGVGNGTENNTTWRLANGWQGLWVEADPRHCKHIRTHLSNLICNGRLDLKECFIDQEKARQIADQCGTFRNVDLLSIDIDGNDFYILEELIVLTPRVVALEYNSRLRPPVKWCMPYNPNHRWAKDDYYGFSLAFIVERMAAKGYTLVSCNLSGNNCFFVNDKEICDHFTGPFSAEHLYQPPRFHLCRPVGHSVSLKVIDTMEFR
ncbi:hypothetical protein GYB59_00430 [bacterium]|nr:hypothetical protein [bacterium]